MMIRGLLALTLAFGGQMAQAEGLTSSVVPQARPGVTAKPMQTTVATANAPAVIKPLTMPRPRPAGLVQAVAVVAPATPDAPVVKAVMAGGFGTAILRPRPRPDDLGQTNIDEATQGTKPARKGWGLFKAAATRTPPGKTIVQPKKGSVCGDTGIRGETLAPVVGKIKACGIADPVRVTAVAGVALSEAATIDCPTAIALKNWVEGGLQPNFGKNPVVTLQIAGHYVCRPRNNVAGAKISEHGRGKALDISGFVLADGTRLSVQGHWRKIKAIKASHKAACGIFGTTLGPGSDGYHEDHLHFDTASYRSGAYCK